MKNKGLVWFGKGAGVFILLAALVGSVQAFQNVTTWDTGSAEGWGTYVGVPDYSGNNLQSGIVGWSTSALPIGSISPSDLPLCVEVDMSTGGVYQAVGFGSQASGLGLAADSPISLFFDANNQIDWRNYGTQFIVCSVDTGASFTAKVCILANYSGVVYINGTSSCDCPDVRDGGSVLPVINHVLLGAPTSGISFDNANVSYLAGAPPTTTTSTTTSTTSTTITSTTTTTTTSTTVPTTTLVSGTTLAGTGYVPVYQTSDLGGAVLDLVISVAVGIAGQGNVIGQAVVVLLIVSMISGVGTVMIVSVYGLFKGGKQ